MGHLRFSFQNFFSEFLSHFFFFFVCFEPVRQERKQVEKNGREMVRETKSKRGSQLNLEFIFIIFSFFFFSKIKAGARKDIHSVKRIVLGFNQNEDYKLVYIKD